MPGSVIGDEYKLVKIVNKLTRMPRLIGGEHHFLLARFSVCL